jgi:hypothetical protein
MPKRILLTIVVSLGILFTAITARADRKVVISVPEQKLAIMENGLSVAQFPV